MTVWVSYAWMDTAFRLHRANCLVGKKWLKRVHGKTAARRIQEVSRSLLREARGPGKKARR